MKILNLYAGLGGNRKNWQGFPVTAVEYSKEIAAAYRSAFPIDEIIVSDAHQYLIEHYEKYGFIWSSPPCQSHTKLILSGRNRTPKYADLGLYQEVIFLKTYFKGYWCVENVDPYYEPLIRPSFKIGRHLFWSNFPVSPMNLPAGESLLAMSIIGLKNWLGLDIDVRIYANGNHDPRQVYRNCVHPAIGLHILNAALRAQDCKEISIEGSSGATSQQLSIFSI